MLPLGHVAYTWAALTWLQSRDLACDVDFRLAAAAALLPDIVDKPLSLTLMADSGTSQGLAHTAAGQAGLLLITACLKPRWLPYALIGASHLVADQMWKYPRTLFFPFSGELDYWKPMGTPSSMLSAYVEIATRPAILAVELVGLGLLGWAVRRAGLHHRRRLAAFLRSGKLELAARRHSDAAQSVQAGAARPGSADSRLPSRPRHAGIQTCAS